MIYNNHINNNNLKIVIKRVYASDNLRPPPTGYLNLRFLQKVNEK